MRLIYPLIVVLALGAYGAPLTPRAEAGASQLLTTQYCEGGRVKVTFSWTGGNAAALEQWLDLSTFDNGWQDGTFIDAGPLVGSLATYTWEGLTPATQHYVLLFHALEHAGGLVQEVGQRVSAGSHRSRVIQGTLDIKANELGRS